MNRLQSMGNSERRKKKTTEETREKKAEGKKLR